MYFALLLAQQQPPDGQQAPWWSNLVMILPLLVFAYLLFMRPMQKQEKQRLAMISSLKKGDKVITTGGIIGVVTAVKDKEDEITLRIDDNSPVRLRVTRSSVGRVIPAGEDISKESKEGNT